MSDFKLLLKRRHLLTQAGKAATTVENQVTSALHSDYLDDGHQEGPGCTANGHNGDDDDDQMSIRSDEHKECIEQPSDVTGTDGDTVTDIDTDTPTAPSSPLAVAAAMTVTVAVAVAGSSLEEDSHLLPLHAQESAEPCVPPPHTSHKRLEKKDLIFSAGTIRSRYRDVRKEEESRVQKKHDRTMKKHSMALIRESLEDRSSPSPSIATTTKKSTRGREDKPTRAPAGTVDVKAANVKKDRTGLVNQRGRRDRDKHGHRAPAVQHSTATADLPPRERKESHHCHPSSIPCRHLQDQSQDQSQSALSRVISKDTANDSIEELMCKYYEHEELQAQQQQQQHEEEEEEEEIGEDVRGGDSEGAVLQVAGGEGGGGEGSLETVVLTESVPFVDYPVNICVIDGLVYSKVQPLFHICDAVCIELFVFMFSVLMMLSLSV
jgi:hypothetical protein